MVATKVMIHSSLFPDSEPPKIACPVNQTVSVYDDQNDKKSASVVWSSPVVTDDSGQEPSVTCNRLSGSRFTLGKTLVMCVAIDGSNNSAICQFEVTVVGMISFIHFSSH